MPGSDRNEPLCRWLTCIRNLKLTAPRRLRSPALPGTRDLTWDIFYNLGNLLEDDQLQTLFIPKRHVLRESCSSLFQNQHHFHALGFAVNSYSLMQRAFIPHLLHQPRLTSLSIECDRMDTFEDDNDYSALISLFDSLSDTLVSLRVGKAIGESSGEVVATILNMKRLEQLAWMSDQRKPDTKCLIVPRKEPGEGINWLRLEIGYRQYSFLKAPFDLSSVRSLHISCPLKVIIKEVLNTCHGLKTINWDTHGSIELRSHPESLFITQHWETLTRLRICKLNVWDRPPGCEDEDPLWYTKFVGGIMENCVNLIEMAIPIPCKVEIERCNRMTRVSHFEVAEDIESSSTPEIPTLQSVISGLKFEWPRVSNNLRCLHFLNSQISKGCYNFQCSDEEYWPVVLTHLLTYIKPPFGASEASHLVPLPRLQVLITGRTERSYYSRSNQYECEAWRVIESISGTPTGIELRQGPWTVENVEMEQFGRQYPQFYGFKYDDERDIWADKSGRFWE
ncbi:hypothetical protein TWF281_007887 [Arthrobotrys megalospora]